MPATTKSKKPTKPYPDYPLTPHKNGQFCKRIRGKLHYFGTDSDEALKRYLDEKDDLHAGRTPNRRGSTTTENLLFAFLDRNEQRGGGTELNQSFLPLSWLI